MRASLLALAGILPLGLSTPAPQSTWIPPIEFEPGDWWNANSFACPLWAGPLPQSAQDLAGSSCSKIWAKTFTGGAITVFRYQLFGPFVEEPRYTEILNGVDAAIAKGLTHMGILAGPLKINIGVVWGTLEGLVNVDDDSTHAKTPCNIMFNFPPGYRKIPTLAIQKEIIRGMYLCVEQFHKPTMTTWTDANEWWRGGIARYFDGLAYPATAAILNRGLYPEEYQHGIPFYQNKDATALFWHFVQGHEGWKPMDVHGWMKGHPNKVTDAEERTSLSTDRKITPAVFHRFILACKDKTIKYPSGAAIVPALPIPPENEYSVVNIASVGTEWTKKIAISAWKGKTHVFPIKAGQKMRVSMVDPKPGVEWSIRKVGTTAWLSGARTRTVDIAASAGSDTKWVIAVSSTRDDAGSGLTDIKFKRI